MSLFYAAFFMRSLRHKPESDGRLFFHRTNRQGAIGFSKYCIIFEFQS